MLNDVIRRRQKTYQIERQISQSFVKGKLSSSYGASEDVCLAIFAVDTKTLRMFPEGTIGSQDVKIYQISGDLQNGDRLTYKNNKFEIREESNRQDDGVFSWYIGRRLNDSNS